MKKEIIQSLKEEAIWIVPASLKNEYERLLIEHSENQTILFQKVMSISLYYQELLKKHHYFRVHPQFQMVRMFKKIGDLIRWYYVYLD